MKNAIACLTLCFCFGAAFSFADPVWSSAFDFDGTPTSETVLLRPTDNIGYSTAIIDGGYKECDIRARNTSDPTINRRIAYFGPSNDDLEGTVNWNYISLDIPKNDTYTITETVMSLSDEVDLNRTVSILPEPAALLLLGLAGAFLLRRRVRLLVACLAAASLFSFGVRAESSVTSVGCLQLWPVDRRVVINFSVASDSSEELNVKFYGTTDNGATTFELKDRGTISKDGASGTVSGAGSYKAVWTPDATLNSFTGKIKIGVEVTEPIHYSAYMVLDLSNYSVDYLEDVPAGGWTSTYKSGKMVFRYVEPGTFMMGSPSGELGRYSDEPEHQVTLTKGFYIGVFEVTDYQYGTIDGTSYSPTGMYKPRKGVTYDAVRGSDAGSGWPGSSAVDSGSFIGKLRAQSGLAFDLPTEAQWEYACRATTTTALNSGKNLSNPYDDCPEMDEVGAYDGNAYNAVDAGSYSPNAWGIYDMHGNVMERCLDWYGALSEADATDPVGPSSGDSRVLRSGSYARDARNCRSASRSQEALGSQDAGLRLVLVVD